MPKKKQNEVAAGVFVLLSLGTMLGVILWLGASQFLKSKGQIVTFYVHQSQGSTGLAEGAIVTYGDATIGRLYEIVPQDRLGRCLYRVQLERMDVALHAGGKARVASPGIGPSKIVVLDSGDPNAGPADDEHPIPLAGGIEQAISDFAETAQKAKEAVAAIQRELDPKGGNLLGMVHNVVGYLESGGAKIVALADGMLKLVDAKDADSPVAKLNKSLGDVNDMTADAKPRVQQILESLASLSRRMDELVKKDVTEFLAKLQETNAEINTMSKNLSEASRQAKEMLAGNRESLDVMVENLTQVSANLKGMSEEVRRKPWLLLYKPTDKELREQSVNAAARSFAEGAAQMNRSIARLKGLIQGGEVKADHPALQQLVKDLQERFSQYRKYEQALWEQLRKESK